ncbi:MAG: dTDP-glucose 4,6-dehydratase [Candidatus Omnitrophica bacterium CG1_02_49_16]|nr:MAG: dTDP-glucose 4,6-dehydratase [Candidatus Omnitrophica bacterium CG1_02_49_16]
MRPAKQTVLVTGGAGFIGSALIKLWLPEDPNVSIVNFDKLTYCGDLTRLGQIQGNPRIRFIQGDVCDPRAVEAAMEGCSAVIHLAAETHVDRSLLDGKSFFDTNTYGTYVLLESARKKGIEKFLLVSTDEVYGSRAKGFFKETDALSPSSPYSVSKTAADLLTLSYAHAYGLYTVVTRGSNTFGSYQYPEKVIPLFVSNALSDEPLPLYGDGLQVRNWMHVEDHCRGILCAFKKGKKGEAYNISTPFYLTNIDLTRRILRILDKPSGLIKKVKDRVGHDRRYAIDPAKIKKLGWQALRSFEESLRETVLWYGAHRAWWQAIKEKQEGFKAYYAQAYQGRGR